MISPDNDVDGLVAVLRALAERHERQIRLLPGLTDAELDACPVRVPDPERALLRQVSGFWVGTAPGVYFGLGGERAIGEPSNWDHAFGGSPDCGPVGTSLFLHDPGNGDTYYVDVDPETGRWGAVFASSPDFYQFSLVYQARSLTDWWRALADGIAADLGEGDSTDIDYMPGDSGSNLASAWDGRIPVVGAIPYKKLHGSLPREAAQSLSDLVAHALVVDLASVVPPARLDIDYGEECERRGAGRFIVVPNPEYPR
ncbi:hypothetical protein ACFXNW_21215 [Nocardia sp. NPDC059180]|uniref:hypothetical protein n=1 Tax=Nocardia sp. NPDC059180 TaxID=3346761 RepID=UPI0036B6F4A0